MLILSLDLYFSQSQRGELVGGMGDPDEPEGLEQGSTLRFLARFARAITACAPVTGGLKVVRQWAGCYDVTPDNNPVRNGSRWRIGGYETTDGH